MHQTLSSFTILIFHLFLLSTSIATAQTLIKATCKKCSQQDPNVPYAFCTTSLLPAPASRCATLKGLGIISIRLARYNLTDTRCHIKQLLSNASLNAFARACLEDCFQLYNDAIPSIKLAMKHFSHKRFNDANIEVSAVMDAATTCEDGFSERPGVVSPLTKRNNDLFQLSAIVLYIMHVLQTGSNS